MVDYKQGDSITLTMETMFHCKHHPDTECPMGRASGLVCMIVPEQHSKVQVGSTWKCRIIKVGLKENVISYLFVKVEEQIRAATGELPPLNALLSEAILKGIEQMSQDRETRIEKNKQDIIALQRVQNDLQDKLNDIESKIATIVETMETDTMQLRVLEEAKKKYDILSTPDCDTDIEIESTEDIENEISAFNSAYASNDGK